MTEQDTAFPPPPRANPDLIGHGAAERRLFDAWRSGRLPHGWLITGPPGIGKATLAFRFARVVLAGGGDGGGLFADEPDERDPLYVDPANPVFQRIAAGGHGDLMTLERGVTDDGRRRTVIVIDDVRRAGGFLRLTAGEGGWRVIVVDAADDLNANAANALLKFLEEPPARTLVLLVSHAPGRLPATVRSRCCRLTLTALAPSTVAELVRRYCPALPDEEAAALARLGEGSIGRALRLAETDGLALYRELLDLVRPLPILDMAAVHGLGERLARRDAETAYRTATDLLTGWIARLVRAGARRGDVTLPGGEVVGGERECVGRLLALTGLEEWIEVWEKVTRLIAQADAVNLDRKQVVLNAFQTMEQAARA